MPEDETEPAASAAPLADVVAGLQARIDAAIDLWLLESFRLGPIARDVETSNAAFHAAQDLKARLAAVLKEN